MATSCDTNKPRHNHDRLAVHIASVEELQGWPSDFLADALLRLTRDADPPFNRSWRNQWSS